LEVNPELVVALSNPPLQRAAANVARSEAGTCRDGAGCARASSRPWYACRVRSAAAAERQIVGQRAARTTLSSTVNQLRVGSVAGLKADTLAGGRRWRGDSSATMVVASRWWRDAGRSYELSREGRRRSLRPGSASADGSFAGRRGAHGSIAGQAAVVEEGDLSLGLGAGPGAQVRGLWR
jgi:hypothetical protein